jgi:dolichyl-phosphate beta-glucosyltransferase
MDLSIIIPVYNEGKKIERDIHLAAEFLSSSKMKGEIIISDDGSTDDTANFVKKINIDPGLSLKTIFNKDHKGKGYAVKSGILEARGQVVLFIDSGSCVPYKDLLPGISMIRTGQCEIAHGSRFMKDSIITRKKQWYRRILSGLFRKFIHLWTKIPENLTDTQCGLKIYKREAAIELYRQCITEGFMFDIEIILRAVKAGYNIKEFPISWTADLDSRLSPASSVFQVLSELGNIKRNIKL